MTRRALRPSTGDPRSSRFEGEEGALGQFLVADASASTKTGNEPCVDCENFIDGKKLNGVILQAGDRALRFRPLSFLDDLLPPDQPDACGRSLESPLLTSQKYFGPIHGQYLAEQTNPLARLEN